jgi:acyl carrier protein
MSAATVSERVRKIVSNLVLKPGTDRNWQMEEIEHTHKIGKWDEPGFGPDLGEDSLDRVEMVMNIEDEFAIEISDQDATEWKTIGDVVEYLEKKLAVP